MSGFYQRFIPSYAKITAPMTDLLKRSCVWHFDDVHRLAVSTLKAAFAQSAVLVFPDPAKEYLFHQDASEFAVGATLSQADSEGQIELNTCMSKKLNAAEQNYPPHEREFLGLMQALRHWRHYVLGPTVIAFTDNVALRHHKTAPNLSPQMVRWLADIEQYNLQIRHIHGATNTAADALSRLACCHLVVSTDTD